MKFQTTADTDKVVIIYTVRQKMCAALKALTCEIKSTNFILSYRPQPNPTVNNNTLSIRYLRSATCIVSNLHTNVNSRLFQSMKFVNGFIP